jgi:endonuclease YncB( thermonuclease family)
LIAVSTPTNAEPINPADVHVIDGDTIRVHHNKPDVRPIGFNAPERAVLYAKRERELGTKATRRLRDLVRGGNLDFEFVPCACSPGTEETPANDKEQFFKGPAPKPI